MSKQTKTEKQLRKIHSRFAELDSQLQLITSPKIFAELEALCRGYRKSDGGGKQSNDAISRLCFAMRVEAFARFGHDSLETMALAKLLVEESRPTFTEKPPSVDAITHINRNPSKVARLDSHQESAADSIKAVWEAFGKFLFMSGRGIGGGGSSRSRALSPLDVISEELWTHHQTIYVPWYNVAKATFVDRQRAGGQLAMAAIVFKILVEDIYPENVDRAFNLVQGTGLRALKAALDAYYDPIKLGQWGRKIPSPDSVRTSETPVSPPEAIPLPRAAGGRP